MCIRDRARGVSEVALSAVNIASPFVNFLFSVSILFAVGTSTVVAIFLGQGRQREANQANTQNMVVTGVLSLFIMLMAVSYTHLIMVTVKLLPDND